MKKTALFFTFVLSVFVFAAGAQEKSEWTIIESPKKDLSVSVPADFLIDKEDKKSHVFAYQEGVTMRVEFDTDEDGKERLRQLRRFSPAKISNFTLGNFVGDVHEQQRAKGFSTQIYTTSSKGFYIISISSTDAQSPLLEKFLYSIRLDERPLYKREGQAQSKDETKISVNSLATSPIILEALKKVDSSKVKIKYEFDDKEKPEEGDEIKYSRALVVLRQPRPSGLRAAQSMRNVSGKVRLKILFLADGTIGDITVLQRPDNGYMKSAADAARRIKFLPAEIDGKPVDVMRIIDYNFF